MLFYSLVVILLPLITNSQISTSPLMGFLNPDNVHRMTDLAVELSSLAARSIAKNEKDVARTVDEPREIPLGARPSEVLGQAVSDVTTQSRMSLLKAFAPLEQAMSDMKPSTGTSTLPTAATSHDISDDIPIRGGGRTLNIKPIDPLLQTTTSSDIRRSHSVHSETLTKQNVHTGLTNDIKSVDGVGNLPTPDMSKAFISLDNNPLIKLASTFLGGSTKETRLGGEVYGSAKQQGELLDFGGIKDYVPGASNNFGLRKGPGCLPFISEFMQVAYGNCQKVADEKAFDAWGEELKSAILTGKVDLLRASQETCRRAAERQQCGALRRAISNCDIIESLQIGAQLQRSMKRCEDVSGLLDQNPLVILSQINNLVGGELAQGFLNKFLVGSK